MMDAHWWGTVIGIVVVILSGASAWGRFNERLKNIEKTLTTCGDHGYVDANHCDKCKAEFHDDINDVAADLKKCTDDFHKFQLEMKGKVGKIDGIVSRFTLGVRS
jgi:hypothetical protein